MKKGLKNIFSVVEVPILLPMSKWEAAVIGAHI